MFYQTPNHKAIGFFSAVLLASSFLVGCGDNESSKNTTSNVIDDTQVVSKLNINQEPITIEGHGLLIIE